MSSHVFTYGSLMFDAVWSRVVQGRYRSIEGSVAEHARFAIDGEDYPGMVPHGNVQTTGLLYLDVDAVDLARLDAFEGDDYRREVVTVAAADGVAREAQSYIYLRRDRLLGAPWEPGAFAMERFLATYCRDRLA